MEFFLLETGPQVLGIRRDGAVAELTRDGVIWETSAAAHAATRGDARPVTEDELQAAFGRARLG